MVWPAKESFELTLLVKYLYIVVVKIANIYVTLSIRCYPIRVQVFDKSGKSLYVFDERDPKDKAKKTTYLVNPRGIGIDGKGQVFVASKITSKIFIFNIKGKYKSSFGSMGVEDEQFNLPNGLFVDGQGRIYITDYGNERVNVYQN